MCTTCAEDGVDVSSVFFDVRFSSFDATMSPLPLRGACQRASIDVMSSRKWNCRTPRLREFMARGAGASDPSK